MFLATMLLFATMLLTCGGFLHLGVCTVVGESIVLQLYLERQHLCLLPQCFLTC